RTGWAPTLLRRPSGRYHPFGDPAPAQAARQDRPGPLIHQMCVAFQATTPAPIPAAIGSLPAQSLSSRATNATPKTPNLVRYAVMPTGNTSRGLTESAQAIATVDRT